MTTLLLRIAAPLQSWGTESKFEIRKTANQPSKSGIVGLVASALGYARDDTEGIKKLNSLRIGIRADREGKLLRDFHTAHSVKSAYVTNRYYLSDAVFLVGLESEDAELLKEIGDALKRPAYSLFLGRRSCPPTLPLFLGIYDEPLETMLGAYRWLVENPLYKENASKLRVEIEPKDISGAAAYTRDKAISFNPSKREYGFRAAYREHYITLRDDAENSSENTLHDALKELEGI